MVYENKYTIWQIQQGSGTESHIINQSQQSKTPPLLEGTQFQQETEYNQLFLKKSNVYTILIIIEKLFETFLENQHLDNDHDTINIYNKGQLCYKCL